MFCNHCGAQLQEDQRFCPSCGKPAGEAAVPPGGSRLARHLRLLGVLWIVISVFRLLGAGVCLIVGNVLFRHIRMPPPVADFLSVMMSLIGGFLLLSAVAGFAAGWGLLQRLPWARVLALIIAGVSLLDIPFGTALGVYTLFVLLPSEADEEYTRMARTA